MVSNGITRRAVVATLAKARVNPRIVATLAKAWVNREKTKVVPTVYATVATLKLSCGDTPV